MLNHFVENLKLSCLNIFEHFWRFTWNHYKAHLAEITAKCRIQWFNAIYIYKSKKSINQFIILLFFYLLVLKICLALNQDRVLIIIFFNPKNVCWTYNVLILILLYFNTDFIIRLPQNIILFIFKISELFALLLNIFNLFLLWELSIIKFSKIIVVLWSLHILFLIILPIFNVVLNYRNQWKFHWIWVNFFCFFIVNEHALSLFFHSLSDTFLSGFIEMIQG